MEFEYSKSTFLEGLHTIFFGFSSVPILFYVFYTFVPSSILKTSALIFIVTTGVLIMSYAVINFRSKSTFKLQISNGHIKQRSPSKFFAESFDLKINDIHKVRIEVDRFGDTPDYKYFLISSDGSKKELAKNYSNPRAQITEFLINNYSHIKVEEV